MQLKHITLLILRFFFFEALVILFLVVEVWFIYFLVVLCLCFLVLLFLFFLLYSKDNVILVCGKINFEFLALASLGQKFLTVIPWICTFSAVWLIEQWSLKQQISKFRTIVLDLRPTLAFIVMALCIISLKWVAS